MNLFSKIKFNDLLLFGLALPIIIYSALRFEGAYPQHAHIIYHGVFLLGLLWSILGIWSRDPLCILRHEPLLVASLCLFYLLCLAQLLGYTHGWTRDPYGTYRALPLVFGYLVFFIVLLDSFRDHRTIIKFLDVLLYFAAGLALLGLLQDIIPNVWRKQMFFTTKFNYEIFATFLSEDRFGFFLNLILPYAFVTTAWELLEHYDWGHPFEAIRHALRRPVAIRLIAVLILLITTGWTGSRSATLTAGIVLTLVALLFTLLIWKKRPHKLTPLLILLAIGAFSIPLLLLFTGVPNALKQVYWWYLNIYGILSGAQLDSSYSGRLQVIHDAIPAILSHPFMGLGLGSFKALFPLYETVTDQGYTWGNAHNEYIELLFETGFLGGVLLIVIPVSLLIKDILWAFKHVSHVRTNALVIFIGLCGGLLCAALHSISDFSLKYPTSMLTFTATAGAAFAWRTALTPRQENVNKSSGWRYGLRNGVTVLGIWLLIGANAAMFESRYAAERALPDLKKASRLHPLNPNYYFDLLRGSVKVHPRNYQEHKELEERILSLTSTPVSYHRLGVIFRDADQQYKARSYFKKAFEGNPTRDIYFFNYLDLLIARLNSVKDAPSEESLYDIKSTIRKKIKKDRSIRSELKRQLLESSKKIQDPFLRKKFSEFLNSLS